jgi:hypothetical protein
MPTHLQISFAESNPDLPRGDCTQEDICQEVRESVEKGIKTVTSAINYINAQHSFTFYCTSDVCSKDPHPSKPKKHQEILCTLWCEKLNKRFDFPSRHEKWRLCKCHSVKERLSESFLIQQLSSHAAKWREIGTHLFFKQAELDDIQARPLLLNGAPKSWLSALISDWMQWAPGDSHGSTKRANLEDLKFAVSEAGLGATAAKLSLQQEVAAGESHRSTDTGRKRKSSSAKLSLQQEVVAGESHPSTDTRRKRKSSSAKLSLQQEVHVAAGQSTDSGRKRKRKSSSAVGSSKRPRLS